METIERKLAAALPVLSDKIKSLTGTHVELHLEVGTGKKVEYYRIKSNDLSSELKGFAQAIFEKINFTTWGGEIFKNDVDEEMIWFAPKMSYKHFSGGSNGTDFIWGTLYFNATKCEWDFDNSRLIFKR